MSRKNNDLYAAVFLGMVTLIAAIFLFFYAREEQRENSRPVVRIVMINKVIDDKNDFWTSLEDGAYMAASDLSMEITVMGPKTEIDYKSQNRMIEEAIQMAPNAILLSPCDYEKTLPYAKKIEEAGISLILVDSALEKKVGDSFVSTDNLEAGWKMGNYANNFLDDNSMIGIIGHTKGSSTAREREAGLRKGLGEAEKQIADIAFCDSNYDKAYNLTKEMLEKHPDMNVIFGLNEYSAVGAARAVKDMGKTGQVRMVGFDNSKEEIQMLEEGVIEAIVVQKPLNMGYLAVRMAYRSATGKDVEENVDSGSVLITKDSLYTDENEKLLFQLDDKE